MLILWFILHYIIAVIVFMIIWEILELDINDFVWALLLLIGFYWYRIATSHIRHYQANEIGNTMNKIFDDQSTLDMDEKIIWTMQKLTKNAEEKYNGNEKELTQMLREAFKKNFYNWTEEQTQESFPSEEKIEESIYAILASLIVNDLELWNIHSPLWKFEYYSFLLFYFLEKLLELWYYEDESELLDTVKWLQIDGWAGFIDMVYERKKYKDEYLEDEKVETWWNEFKNKGKVWNNLTNNLTELASYLYQKIEEKDFDDIIKIAENLDGKSLISSIEDKHLRDFYSIVFWIAYQEKWIYSVSEVYFEKFMADIDLDAEQIQKIENSDIKDIDMYKLWVLMNSLDDIGFELNIDRYRS